MSAKKETKALNRRGSLALLGFLTGRDGVDVAGGSIVDGRLIPNFVRNARSSLEDTGVESF